MKALEQCVDLAVVAERLGQPRAVLVDLARRGQFPRLVRLTERRASVRLDDLVAWLATREVSPGTETLRAEFLGAAAGASAMPRDARPRTDSRNEATRHGGETGRRAAGRQMTTTTRRGGIDGRTS